MNQPIFINEKRYLIMALLIFLVVNISAAVEVHFQRNIPWEPDDHYHFIVKAGNLINSLSGPTPGLSDIYRQTTLNGDENSLVKEAKIRQRHHILQSYHPLYTTILAAFKYVGVSYERTQSVLEIVGVTMVGFSIAFFCSTIFGKFPAAIALIIFSIIGLRGWSIHYISPAILSSTCGLISLGFIASQKRWKLAYSFIALFASVTFHAVGIFLAAAIVLAITLLQWRRPNVRLAIFIVVSIVSMLFFYKYHFQFVDEAIPLVGTYVYDNFLSGIFSNVNSVIAVVKRDIGYVFPNYYKWVGLLLFVSVVLIKKVRTHLAHHILQSYQSQTNNNNLIFKVYAISLLSILVLSCFSLVSANVFDRMKLVYYIFFGGFICSIIWSVLYDLLSSVRKLFLAKARCRPLSLNASKQAWSKCFCLIGVSILCTNFLIYNAYNYQWMVRGKIVTNNMVFDREQVSELLDISNEDDKVLYNLHSNSNGLIKGVQSYRYINKNSIGLDVNEGAEAATYFYLSYGASKRGAVISTAVSNLEDEIFRNNDDLRYMVTLAPPTVLFSGDLFLTEGDLLSLMTSQLQDPIKHLSIFFENKSPGHTVFVKLQTLTKDYAIKVPSGATRWFDFNLASENNLNDKLSISISELPLFDHENIINHLRSFWRFRWSNKRIRVAGIRINDQTTYWPWDSNYKIEIYKQNWGGSRKTYEIPFKTSMLSPTKNVFVDRIINDKGSIVLTSLKTSLE